MPKFGWCKFAEDKFGDKARYHNWKFRMIGAVPVGVVVRRTIGKGPKCTTGAVTFRIRRGNGSYGSVAGKIYQDKYNYTAAMKAVNTGLTPNKTNFATAIDYWQNILTASQKKEYNERASRRLRMSGYNLFLREALTGVYHMYVDRGDPTSADFAKEDLPVRNAWHDLDLSSIVPKTARAVLLYVTIKIGAANRVIRFRKNGNAQGIVISGVRTQVADVYNTNDMIVACDTDGIIEYWIEDVAWTIISVTVKGWWT